MLDCFWILLLLILCVNSISISNDKYEHFCQQTHSHSFWLIGLLDTKCCLIVPLTSICLTTYKFRLFFLYIYWPFRVVLLWIICVCVCPVPIFLLCLLSPNGQYVRDLCMDGYSVFQIGRTPPSRCVICWLTLFMICFPCRSFKFLNN